MLELRIEADTSGGEESKDSEGRWPIAHVEVVGDPPQHHNFADSIVAKGMERGFISFEGLRVETSTGYSRNPVVTGDVLVLHTKGKKLRYEIKERPGRYDDTPEDEPPREHHEYVCRLVD